MKSPLFKFCYLLPIFILVLLTSCSRHIEKTELIVLTRNAPTTWYEGRETYAGPEYDLINSFALYKKLTIRYVEKDSINELLSAIKNGEGDMVAAGLSKTSSRLAQGFKFGPAYQHVQQQVVCRRNNGKTPQGPDDLVGRKIMVASQSSYEELLQKLKDRLPKLEWIAHAEYDTEQLLQMVWKKEIDCTIADSNIVSINRRYYPELIVAFTIDESQPLAWILSNEVTYLQSDIKKWLSLIKSNGELSIIMDRYFGHVTVFDYVDMRQFKRRIVKRLPKFKQHFEKAALDTGIPWELLAAQAYQESHWSPHAKSPTGVRGMMMLTLNTAKSVGVTNRLDPVQSIQGGAKYIQRMLKRIPDTVSEQDRLWFALAAYNVGYGHVKDARALAKSMGKNPDLWVELKSVLPLLSQKKYYKKLKYGYARGTEPVRYVQRIRNYRQVLESTL